MISVSFIRKVVIVPIYTTIFGALLTACGGKNLNVERDSGAKTNTPKTAQEQTQTKKSPTATSGFALTLPADMPQDVDTVSITLIPDDTQVPPTNEPVPPVAVDPWDRPFNRLPPCSIAQEVQAGLASPQNGQAGMGQTIAYHHGPIVVVGSSAGQVGQISAPSCGLIGGVGPALGAPVSSQGVDAGKPWKKEKRRLPPAMLGSGSLIKPVAMVPRHWVECGTQNDTFGNMSPLDALAGALSKDQTAGAVKVNGPLGDLFGSTDAISSSFNYSFDANQKEFSIPDLPPGSYTVVVELIDGKTGRVIESGEGKAKVEVGKVATANIKLTPAPVTTGSISIVVERAGTQTAAK